MANTIRGKATVSQNTQSQVIGITAPVPMGEWQVATPYLKLNVVRYNGASYIAKKQSSGVEPTVTTGWQEVWQPVAYDGLVTPVGNYPDMTAGKAIQAENDGTGKNIADQFSAIDEVIPSTASADNQLADKAFVNSSVNAMAAFYITYNADGDAFPTRADLLNATTFYCGGEARVPTQNDYALVLADESQAAGVDGSYPTTRYSYQGGTYPDGQWDFQYVVNNTSLTQAQVDAINSGITKDLVEQIGKGNVLSVNGETGAVTITPESIGAVSPADFDRLILETEYPVGGKPYIQYPNMITPAERWAGTTWEIDTSYAGRTIIGSSAGGVTYPFGATGGEATHTLSTAEMPKHTHYLVEAAGGSFVFNIDHPATSAKESTITNGQTAYADAVTFEGSSQAHNNMPPYVVVNYWKRTA